MGFRFRKSIKLAPGVRFNLSSRSTGLSFGGKGLRYSINSRSGGRLTASIPGTGLTYSAGSSGTRTRRTTAYQRRSELTRMQRELARMEEQRRAKYEVELYENHLEMIHSIHKECDDPIDWIKLQQSRPPFRQGQQGPKQQAAELELSQYKPGFFDKLFRRAEKKRAALVHAISQARQEDISDYEAWKETVALSESILSGNTDSYLKVIEEMDPLGDLSEFGSGFEFFVGDDPKVMTVEFDVQSDKVVPKEIKTLTQTGKLSVREMPKTKYYDYEQDYVCSCTIRIARDLFALLPIEEVYIHAMDDKLNTAIGRREHVTILSIKIDRQTLNTLSLDSIDCSDAMVNFKHRMRFLKTSGFQPIERLE